MNNAWTEEIETLRRLKQDIWDIIGECGDCDKDKEGRIELTLLRAEDKLAPRRGK